ncbi:hypothetical protein M0802_013384 [Mischocyttarus mexicanus]|nr:hypothetical protein M0802_013384 [Mischocyttarus mexicanus]
MKQLDHERRKKKGEEKMQADSEQANMSIKQEKDLEIKTDDLVVKIKNTGPLILNGRAALAAGKDDYTSDEEEESGSHKFQKSTDKADTMKILLESGCIPDAAMIHAARKRRQKARELGTDYIPLDEQSDEKGKSRLIREEDHDRSDDDSQDRIDMTVNTEARDKEKRREAFLASQVSNKLSDEESENENEEEEWEAQQIRKGVTGAQIAAVHQDSMIQQQFTLGLNVNQMVAPGVPLEMVMMPAPPPPPTIQPPDPTKVVPITPQEVINKMRTRLDSLKEVHSRHQLDQHQLEQELVQTVKELDEGEARAPQLAQRFRYYQELRGYVTDLVECLDEKLPLVIGLEQRWLDLYGERSIELMERRRQDTRDQAEEITTAARGQAIRRGPEIETRIRRVTEREGRRARRRRARELAPTLPKHIDGMSSDDEVTEQQNLAFKQTKEEIDKEGKEIFADVMDDYCTLRGILTKLELWRETDIDAYMEAYVSLCIPKILSPLIRLQLITWNPIMESADIERTKWYNTLLLYALDKKETEDSLKRDPDVRLVPLTVEKVVIPKLTAIVDKIWDPMSTSQTLRLVGTVNRLIRDYPNLNDTSKPLESLFNSILEKVKSAVENDVFIPIFPKQILDNRHQFFQRQFAMAVKLLRNLLSWQGLLGDAQLKNLALGSLLNRYLLAGLRVSSPPDALFKANMIMSTLPRAWLQGETIEHLRMFATLIQQLSEQLDQANPAHNIQTIHGLFTPGKEYRYLYNATSSSGVLLPSGAASSWGLNGILVIQGKENSAVMQFQSLKMNIWNGKIGENGEDIDINESAADLLMPFEVTYNMGLVENLTIQNESVWVTNIKRSIVGILQLDLSTTEKEAAFISTEAKYVISSENDDEKIIRKSLNPKTCLNHSFQFWTNVPRMECSLSEQDPILKSSERLYYVRYNNTVKDILYINATGGIYVQPFQSFGEAHFSFSKQNFQLIMVQDTVNFISLYNPHTVTLQHELPEEDLTQGRGAFDKDTIFKVIGNLLDQLSQRLETPGLDTETDNLHNTTISTLLYYLRILDVTDLEIVYNNISGTSYKEETIRNMFLETLPQIGSKESAFFIFNLIQRSEVSDITAIQLLTQLPFHIRKPDVELLISLKPLLSLSNEISIEVQNTAILSYGTLIYKTCLVKCSAETLDDYVRLYLDKFTESNVYETKMVWLEGLANIQLGRVIEFLEPIASGNNAESRHFRVLAAWASLPSARFRGDIIYSVYWPILVNKTEHLEMRVAALTLLIVSNPTPNRLISLYWYMQTEPNKHLYNYFYTTLKSMEQTTYPCYLNMGSIAAQFTRVLRKPSNNELLLTGNYLFDYKDSYRKFGAMVHGIVIANPDTNVPEAMHVTVSNYGSGTTLNHVSLYIKAEGLLHSLSTYLENPTLVKDILGRYKLKQKETGLVHLEIIARVQEKTVLCLHLNQMNIAKIVKYLASLPDNIYQIYQNTEFHINQQRINIPITMESIQVSDMGTNVILSMTATSLFSMRGNFIHADIGRNNHVILRTSIHGSETISNYNPLVDLWHSAERAQSIHGYLPINVTIGLNERLFVTYYTPGEDFKMGITAHVRTVTNIRGSNAQNKLKPICPNCPMSYTVRKTLPTNKLKLINVLELEFPALGGKIFMKLFDCENAMSRENVITDILSSHQANYQIWPGMKVFLAAVHLLDYFTYVPPKGSCGLTFYVGPFDTFTQTQVKLEYVKNKKHHILSLTNRELNFQRILYQWNLAAVYDMTSWISDNLKIKTIQITPDGKIVKYCIEADREMDWEWEFLNLNPAHPSKLKFVLIWGPSNSTRGKCNGTVISFNASGEVSQEQNKESLKEKWPYDQCRKDLETKNFVPYTDACYETSKELSILRKYQIFLKYENLPEPLSEIVSKLRIAYNLFGGNNYYANNSGQFFLSAVFPKDSDNSILELDSNKVTIQYDSNFVDNFLMRTRIHKYIDSVLFNSFFSTCIVEPNIVRSIYNTTIAFNSSKNILLLGQCYDDNPRFALRALQTENNLINILITDETGTIKIVQHLNEGRIYNVTSYVSLEQNAYQYFGPKWIKLRDRSIDILFPNILLYMHWTKQQVILLFPTYLTEFCCGMCTVNSPITSHIYEEL